MSDYMERQVAWEARVREIGGAAYSAVTDGHFKTYQSFQPACGCGRTFTTEQGLGLHLGAIDRQADKAWDAAVEAARPELNAILAG